MATTLLPAQNNVVGTTIPRHIGRVAIMVGVAVVVVVAKDLSHPWQKLRPGRLLLWRRLADGEIAHVDGIRPLHLLESSFLSLFALQRVVVPVRVALGRVVTVMTRRHGCPAKVADQEIASRYLHQRILAVRRRRKRAHARGGRNRHGWGWLRMTRRWKRCLTVDETIRGVRSSARRKAVRKSGRRRETGGKGLATNIFLYHD